MASQAQIDANRANARHSTGPKTQAGKAQVARNSLRHGFTASELYIAAGEQPEFDALAEELHADVQPVGGTENALFEQYLHAAWNLRRARRLEAGALALPPTDPDAAAAQDRHARYVVRFERAFDRALRQIRAVKNLHGVKAAWVEATGLADSPVLLDYAKVAKQTQYFFRNESMEDDLARGLASPPFRMPHEYPSLDDFFKANPIGRPAAPPAPAPTGFPAA